MFVTPLLLVAVLASAGCFNPDVANGRFTCTLANPGCPEGLTCISGSCESSGSMPIVRGADITITKTGAAYTGTQTPPSFASASDCPDQGEEPNDGPDPYGQPLAWAPRADNATPPTIGGKAICPTGPNPATNNHDVDFYKIDNSAGSGSLTLVANIEYDISHGDLDVAIYDSNMNQLVADGTAVSNGCVSTTISNGIYYVVVAGANNMDINNFSIQMATWSTTHSCPGSTSP